jgi:AraC family transcriptional regulator of arabinose operon
MAFSTAFFPDETIVSSRRILNTSSSFARANLLYLQETGRLRALQVHASHRNSLSSYLFFMVLKGSGTLRIHEKCYEMKKGDCAFIDCMDDYSHESSPDFWQLAWVHFNGPNMPAIYEKYCSRGGKNCFHSEEPEKFLNVLNDIYATAQGTSYIRDVELNEELSRLITELMRYSWNPEDQKTVHKKLDLNRLREYLDAHYTEEIRIDDLAAKHFVNASYMEHLFKDETGMTITGYLANLRITTAKKYLRFTDWSISKIALACGYREANYFIRSFRKAEDMTPGEFRRLWRGEQ